jgi:hypothetical protein
MEWSLFHFRNVSGIIFQTSSNFSTEPDSTATGDPYCWRGGFLGLSAKRHEEGYLQTDQADAEPGG